MNKIIKKAFVSKLDNIHVSDELKNSLNIKNVSGENENTIVSYTEEAKPKRFRRGIIEGAVCCIIAVGLISGVHFIGKEADNNTLMSVPSDKSTEEVSSNTGTEIYSPEKWYQAYQDISCLGLNLDIDVSKETKELQYMTDYEWINCELPTETLTNYTTTDEDVFTFDSQGRFRSYISHLSNSTNEASGNTVLSNEELEAIRDRILNGLLDNADEFQLSSSNDSSEEPAFYSYSRSFKMGESGFTADSFDIQLKSDDGTILNVNVRYSDITENDNVQPILDNLNAYLTENNMDATLNKAFYFKEDRVIYCAYDLTINSTGETLNLGFSNEVNTETTTTAETTATPETTTPETTTVNDMDALYKQYNAAYLYSHTELLEKDNDTVFGTDYVFNTEDGHWSKEYNNMPYGIASGMCDSKIVIIKKGGYITEDLPVAVSIDKVKDYFKNKNTGWGKISPEESHQADIPYGCSYMVVTSLLLEEPNVVASVAFYCDEYNNVIEADFQLDEGINPVDDYFFGLGYCEFKTVTITSRKNENEITAMKIWTMGNETIKIPSGTKVEVSSDYTDVYNADNLLNDYGQSINIFYNGAAYIVEIADIVVTE